MKKIYRILLLLLVFIFLSTFNPKELNLISRKSDNLFEIKSIVIENNFLIKTSEIKNKLQNIYKKNIFYLKKIDIENPLRDTFFLEKIEVKKRYPSTVLIKIFETKPAAILFKDKTKYLLDSSSNLIPFEDNINTKELPNIFGEGAEDKFIYFFEKLKKHKFPNNKINNFYYFQIGRWDVQLINRKIIKFPYNNIDDAIVKSVELLNREDFKNYNIIDLRIEDKIIVE